MPETDRNQIDSEGRGRSVAKGDIPERIKRRYFLDERGGPGLGFYVDARIKSASFRDLGGRLTASRTDPNAVQDMVRVAGHRGWSVVVVHGEAEFRREAWLAAMAVGIEARGYRPRERDLQDLERKRDGMERRAAKEAATLERRGEPNAAARANLRVVEAVVRARVADEPSQKRILAGARSRLADLLEQGVGISALKVDRREGERGRDRQRTR